jgi:hypothetical protein
MTITSFIRILVAFATCVLFAEVTEKINDSLVKYNMEREIIMETA